MKVYRLTEPAQTAGAYPCATEGGPFWADGLPLSRAWLAENLGHYVEGLHLEDDAGQVIGHLYWAPSERALAPYRIEEGAAYLYCDWVQRRHRGQGGSRLLFDAFLELLRAEGGKGVLVDATEIEDYMHRRHYERRGFRPLRRQELGLLLYLPLGQKSVRVEPLSPNVQREGTAPVEVLVIGSRFCPVGASALLSLRQVAAEFPGQVLLREVPAGPETMARYGVADGIFLNGRPRFFGPVTLAQVRETIQQELEGQGPPIPLPDWRPAGETPAAR